MLEWSSGSAEGGGWELGAGEELPPFLPTCKHKWPVVEDLLTGVEVGRVCSSNRNDGPWTTFTGWMDGWKDREGGSIRWASLGDGMKLWAVWNIGIAPGDRWHNTV